MNEVLPTGFTPGKVEMLNKPELISNFVYFLILGLSCAEKFFMFLKI